jgi:hypothetical protein
MRTAPPDSKPVSATDVGVRINGGVACVPVDAIVTFCCAKVFSSIGRDFEI